MMQLLCLQQEIQRLSSLLPLSTLSTMMQTPFIKVIPKCCLFLIDDIKTIDQFAELGNFQKLTLVVNDISSLKRRCFEIYIDAIQLFAGEFVLREELGADLEGSSKALLQFIPHR